jgi:hypothetical protein
LKIFHKLPWMLGNITPVKSDNFTGELECLEI